MDGFLARLGLLRWLAALPRMLLLVGLWLAVVAVCLPIGVTIVALGLLALVWGSLDDVVATILGHDDDDGAPALPVSVVKISREVDERRARRPTWSP